MNGKLSWDRIVGMTVVIIFSFMCLFPLWAVISISFSNERYISYNGYTLIPPDLSLDAYKWVFQNSGILLIRAYVITIFVTVFGTILSLFTMSLMAFAISRNDFAWKRQLSFFAYFTLLFNGGLVPTYMVIARLLNLKDTIWVLILPYVMNAWNLLLMRTFFKNIPAELFESAEIDGASDCKIYSSIVLPLGRPAFAAIGILVALKYWNDWWLPLLYINNVRLTNLQFMLYRIMANLQAITELAQLGIHAYSTIDYSQIPGETMRMAMCVIVAGPMLIIFPFFQKHFARGLTAGSIKG